MMQFLPYRTTLFLLLTTFCRSAFGGEAADDVAFFENKIRPVLVKHCYECHSADAKELGGKLLLDQSRRRCARAASRGRPSSPVSRTKA